MKSTRMCSILICIFWVFSSLSGCDLTPPVQYPFRQERENIQKVEICTYNDETRMRETLIELSESDVDSLLNDISALECYDHFSAPPILRYGDVIILITYQSGEAEMIGILRVSWFSAEGKEIRTGYFFNIKDICAVIAKYVDPQVLKEVSSFF